MATLAAPAVAPVVLLAAAPALAQLPPHPIPESERWATITHAGNAPWVGPIHPTGNITLNLGRVDYEYRISRTEVTGAEWFEFVQAYAPYAGQDANSSTFIGNLVTWHPASGYGLRSGAENKPIARIGWRFAARYVNWLHNGKANTPEAFEAGAYDTSTFGDVPGGGITDQATHSLGARYWIPSLDELVKASHFDPDRHGPGQPGYWLYPTSSDTAPVWGPPGVGQSHAGSGFLYEVAAFRDVQSPWGLWDTSGGVTEWTETLNNTLAPGHNPDGRWIDGSSWVFGLPIPDIGEGPFTADRIDYFGSGFPDEFHIGLRIAREVPSQSSAVVLLGAVPLLARKRRTAHETHRSDYGLPVRPRRRAR